jgi:hypothetical protein
VIVDQQLTGINFAEAEAVPLTEALVSLFIGAIKPEGSPEEPDNRRFSWPIKTAAPLSHSNASHGGKRRVQDEYKVLTHGCSP